MRIPLAHGTIHSQGVKSLELFFSLPFFLFLFFFLPLSHYFSLVLTVLASDSRSVFYSLLLLLSSSGMETFDDLRIPTRKKGLCVSSIFFLFIFFVLIFAWAL